MKAKKVWRYYCEYCKKSGCSKYWMRRHEERCTLNPNRICGYCKLIDDEQPEISELLSLLPELEQCKEEYMYYDKEMCISYDSDMVYKGVEKIREITNCPACMEWAISGAVITILCTLNISDFSISSYIIIS